MVPGALAISPCLTWVAAQNNLLTYTFQLCVLFWIFICFHTKFFFSLSQHKNFECLFSHPRVRSSCPHDWVMLQGEIARGRASACPLLVLANLPAGQEGVGGKWAGKPKRHCPGRLEAMQSLRREGCGPGSCNLLQREAQG